MEEGNERLAEVTTRAQNGTKRQVEKKGSTTGRDVPGQRSADRGR